MNKSGGESGEQKGWIALLFGARGPRRQVDDQITTYESHTLCWPSGPHGARRLSKEECGGTEPACEANRMSVVDSVHRDLGE